MTIRYYILNFFDKILFTIQYGYLVLYRVLVPTLSRSSCLINFQLWRDLRLVAQLISSHSEKTARYTLDSVYYLRKAERINSSPIDHFLHSSQLAALKNLIKKLVAED